MESDCGSVSVRIRSFTASDGSEVPVSDTGVFLIVGPNNAGKSQALRDIRARLSSPDSQVKTIVDVTVEKNGSSADFVAWVKTKKRPRVNDNGQELYHMGALGAVDIDKAGPSIWEEGGLKYLVDHFVLLADVSARLREGLPAIHIDFARDSLSHPLHYFYRDADLEKQLHEASRSAFGVGVCVDRFRGTKVGLRVGDPPVSEFVNGIPDAKYLEALSALPALDDQGDGMKGYLGLLLHVLAGTHDITLLDEPEAFLHPPQARLLGTTLAQLAAQSQQIFAATHSSDVIQGAVDSAAEVTIARVTRIGNRNHFAVLSPDQVRQLWKDPLLRYSNLLDGLFHDAVVLCEADGDCRYYSSVLDSVRDCEGLPSSSASVQLQFSHCGGKGRFSSATQLLKTLSIPVVVVADFDLLNDKGTLRRTLESLGGNFSEIERDWTILNSALTSSDKSVKKNLLEDALREALTGMQGPNISRSDAKLLRGLIKVESGWDKVKGTGLSGVPGGDAYEACERLLAALQDNGLLVVPVGELERFAPSVSGHGPEWVADVHERRLHEDRGQSEPREFVAKIAAVAAARADALAAK